MATYIKEPGDKTSHETRPDFEGAKGYYWMKQVHAAKAAGATGNLPHKPRKTLAERSFFSQVDRRLTRQSYTMGASFDENGRLVRE